MEFLKKRLTARLVLMTVLGLMAAGTLAAQGQKVKFSSQALTVGQALDQIENQTHLVVAYSSQSLDRSRKVTFSQTESSVKDLLTRLLAGTGQTFEIKDNYIFLRVIPQPRPVAVKAEPAPAPAPKPEVVRGLDIPTQTYRFDLTPEPQPVPAPRGGYPTATRFTETPRWAVKSNLLWDATASVNLAAEIRLGHKTTLDLPVSFNFWSFGNERKWKHTLYQPGIRFWPCEAFNGFFWGVHAHYGSYNIGNLPSPPFSGYAETYRFEGWLAGAGVNAGYHWIFGKRWALEAELGAGYAYLDYKTYRCENCGRQVGAETKNYFGPTKAAVSLVFMIK